MPLPVLLKLIGYIFGGIGIVMLIWSMLKQGVSLFGLVLLSAGFLLLVLADFMAYNYSPSQAPQQNIGRLHVLL